MSEVTSLYLKDWINLQVERIEAAAERVAAAEGRIASMVGTATGDCDAPQEQSPPKDG